MNFLTNSADEMALLLVAVYLVYKLRNASSDTHKEKFVLSASVFVELIVSSMCYAVRHAFWRQLHSNQMLLLDTTRSQLTVTLTLALVLGPKVSLLCVACVSWCIAARARYLWRPV